LHIRLATPADIPAILALEQLCPSAAHWSETQYRNLFRNEMIESMSSRVVLLAEETSEKTSATRAETQPALLAFLVAHRIDREWELENIAVAPAARRRGLATMLIEELFRRAREKNSNSIFLEVRESNQLAQSLYEKLGFAKSGLRKGYYQAPPEDAITYRRLL
jgi:[ribosomal protein S18]-alanine N-acetyltransferase